MADRTRRTVLASVASSLTLAAGCTSTNSAPTTSASAETPVQTTDTETTQTVGTATTTTAPPPDIVQTGPPTAGVDAFDEAIPRFLAEWDIPGASVAVSQAGSLVFVQGYGYADAATESPVRPTSLFRVASISKPITATAVLSLIERGELALDDRAFDILTQFVPEDGPADPRVSAITIRQLLRHTAGWSNRALGFDPMFAPEYVANEMGTEPPASAETTIRFMLQQDLGFDPGTDFEYANFGYCVLGRIIEAVTGQPYEQYVKEAVLDPLGATRMQIGATRRAGRLEDEVRYHDDQTLESPFPDTGEVPRPYAAGHLETMDANGGWVGSTIDLLRFVRGLDGDVGVPDVINVETRATMTARPDLDHWRDSQRYYGMGVVVSEPESGRRLWHNGSLPGSHGLVLFDEQSQLGVAILLNARSSDIAFSQFQQAFQSMVSETYPSVSEWPDRDLFDEFP